MDKLAICQVFLIALHFPPLNHNPINVPTNIIVKEWYSRSFEVAVTRDLV